MGERGSGAETNGGWRPTAQTWLKPQQARIGLTPATAIHCSLVVYGLLSNHLYISDICWENAGFHSSAYTLSVLMMPILIIFRILFLYIRCRMYPWIQSTLFKYLQKCHAVATKLFKYYSILADGATQATPTQRQILGAVMIFIISQNRVQGNTSPSNQSVSFTLKLLYSTRASKPTCQFLYYRTNYYSSAIVSNWHSTSLDIYLQRTPDRPWIGLYILLAVEFATFWAGAALRVTGTHLPFS